jgi:predicted DNA-binding protein
MNEKNNGFSIELDKTHLNEIEDVYNSNIEVFVTLQDGFSLTIVVGTPKNLQYLMEKDKVNFYGPGLPWIIVQKLTKGIIQEAIEAYIDDKADAYWLKLYHFAPDIDIAIFNQLQAQEIAEFAQFKLLIGLDDLKAKINKLDNLDKSKKSDLIASLDKLYKDLRI